MEENNIIQLNQKDLEEKFDRLEQYITELNSELNILMKSCLEIIFGNLDGILV